ncbi:MAG: hypothetical protein RBR50_04300 [Candidatus Izemoplasmatales bacterium]|jgi:hypothetical protein|nr:hypothetical protein [Candidatus Izemoplasmatales bacterium]
MRKKLKEDILLTLGIKNTNKKVLNETINSVAFIQMLIVIETKYNFVFTEDFIYENHKLKINEILKNIIKEMEK